MFDESTLVDDHENPSREQEEMARAWDGLSSVNKGFWVAKAREVALYEEREPYVRNTPASGG